MEIIKLFIANIELGFSHRHSLLMSISEKQKEKALKFKNEKDQIRSMISSSLINSLSNEEILFNEMGKPYYQNGPFFNVSHSGQFVIMAVSNKEIGVDIEENNNSDMSPLIKIFNEAEVKLIKEHADFYYLWCAKESLIKCMGSSINKVKEVPSLPLNGLKTFKGKDYQCQTFIYEKHIVSITREGNEEFAVKIENVNKLPLLIK